jgi:hypothetical protein
MSFISSDIKKGKVSGAVLSAAVAYGFGYDDLLSLGIAGAAGFFIYPVVQKRVMSVALPVIPADKRDFVLPAALGAAAGYGLYGGDLMFTAAGAGAGAALEYFTNKY